MIKVGIVGGTGYTGIELLRILAFHPQVEITVITSRSQTGTKVSDLFSNLRGHLELSFTNLTPKLLADQCEVVFFATPHGVAMDTVAELLSYGTRVIDLSADFRLSDPALWERWYGQPHTAPDLLSEAVYGLPEINKNKISKARLVACPGCYPTTVQLGFLPLLEENIIELTTLIADAKSGVSGAGRKAAIGTSLCEASENFKAYSVAGHRHHPEIVQGLSQVCDTAINLTFVPHLVPMIRGIHATLYAQLKKEVDVQALFELRYTNSPFVDILPPNSHPETRSVRGSNMCRIAVHRPSKEDNRIVILSVTDNLVKGASGQAVQNMNLMFDLPETTGLTGISLMP
ncbi:N-acetyl-gamma-glutamyl-phosphate reductase [Candidatus Nitrosacidococcus tergens]|uniref:N-acetyl-gamma-glutamyl-phosphate reductase n=1 Tax=Candidatus Nitrosacidococcus tergens TaxID=553981 RepID=A0A7G1QC76_9GAMM|nr:N-acetyl-gamma-glutamyl-phosphate reductase [Candidatus Nitrosacidococcus tergens]CAB1277202.1 N-acetyl-gamma-glutamyl-phosphate reductase [Candidatus Nitrosacidococcus tergens]